MQYGTLILAFIRPFENLTSLKESHQDEPNSYNRHSVLCTPYRTAECASLLIGVGRSRQVDLRGHNGYKHFCLEECLEHIKVYVVVNQREPIDC